MVYVKGWRDVWRSPVRFFAILRKTGVAGCGAGDEDMKQLILTAWTVTGLALCGAAPDEFPSCADARDEIQKTWRLLERDLRNWNRPRPNANAAVPNFQPPADQVVYVEALVSEKDRDPLDVLLRRTAALHADLAGQVDLGAEGAARAGPGASRGEERTRKNSATSA